MTRVGVFLAVGMLVVGLLVLLGPKPGAGRRGSARMETNALDAPRKIRCRPSPIPTRGQCDAILEGGQALFLPGACNAHGVKSRWRVAPRWGRVRPRDLRRFLGPGYSQFHSHHHRRAGPQIEKCPPWGPGVLKPRNRFSYIGAYLETLAPGTGAKLERPLNAARGGV